MPSGNLKQKKDTKNNLIKRVKKLHISADIKLNIALYYEITLLITKNTANAVYMQKHKAKGFVFCRHHRNTWRYLLW